jgi:small subunit ribosomal protein S6
LLCIKTGLYQPKGGIMRRYETIIIIDPDLSAEEREPVLARVKDVIAQQDGYLAFIDDWGTRKLAYEIKKKARGYYVRFDFCGTGAVVDEIERFFRIDDRVLKYMTVLLDKIAEIEKIKEEVAAAESKADVPEEPEKPAETEAPADQAKPAAVETPADQTKPAEAGTSEDQTKPAETGTPADQAKPAETETPADQTKPAETETPEDQTKPAEAGTPEDQTKPAEAGTPEDQAEPSETLPPEPEVNEADTTPTETEEEIK